MFDHEKLRVYQYSLEFNSCAGQLLDAMQRKISVCNHLDESAASISLNIAEGNGKYTSKDRCKYFDIARGSALECAGCLDILVQRNCINLQKANEGKQMLFNIVSMLVGLIKSNSERLHEPDVKYGIDTE